jgi:hypothetical protein
MRAEGVENIVEKPDGEAASIRSGATPVEDTG